MTIKHRILIQLHDDIAKRHALFEFVEDAEAMVQVLKQHNSMCQDASGQKPVLWQWLQRKRSGLSWVEIERG